LVTARLTTSSRGTGRLKAHLALDDTFTLGRCTMVTQQTTVVGNPFRPIPTMDHPCFEQGRGTSVREPTARGCHVGPRTEDFFFFFFFLLRQQFSMSGFGSEFKHLPCLTQLHIGSLRAAFEYSTRVGQPTKEAAPISNVLGLLLGRSS
jgi:hypothetical protein